MPLFVIVSREQLLLDEETDRHIPPDTECKRFSGPDLDANQIFEHVATMDLFADAQCFLYSDVTGLKLRKAEINRLETPLKNLPERITLICTGILSEDSRAKEMAKLKSAEITLFTSLGKLIDLRTLSEFENAVGWLKSRADKLHGLVLTKQQADKLYETCGASLTLASAELAKLAIMKGDDRRMPVSDNLLDSVITSNPQAEFYSMAELILSGDQGSIERIREWFGSNPESFRMISELSRRLLGAKALRDGITIQSAFLVRQYRGLDQRFPGNKLDRAVKLCAELEHGLKSGAYLADSREKGELAALEIFNTRIRNL